MLWILCIIYSVARENMIQVVGYVVDELDYLLVLYEEEHYSNIKILQRL